MTEFGSLAPDTRPTPVTAFDQALKSLLDDLFELDPVWATQIGFHAHDDRWPDMTPAGRQARLAAVARHRTALQQLDDASLSSADGIDRGIVLEALDALEFGESELREDAWNALSYVSLAGGGLFSLLAREFAPWAQRGAALAGRLRGLPALLETAAGNLVGLAGRPVSALHTQVALAQLSGISDLVDQGIAEAQRQAPPEAAVARAIADAAGPARAAVDEFRRRLELDILPHSEGDGRLGLGALHGQAAPRPRQRHQSRPAGRPGTP